MVDDEKTLLLKSTEMIFDKLKQLRQSAYTLLSLGKDAIFDLMDAVLTSPRGMGNKIVQHGATNLERV